MLVASSCLSTEEVESFRLLNEERQRHGLETLANNEQLNAKAQAWARAMADSRQLSHSVLSDGAPPGWRLLAENVGVGPNVARVASGFLDSPPHRASLLSPNFSEVGIGVAQGSDGRYYVVHVFMD
ncbi:MAG: CAP domain-containing protein [Actinomycetota bacterium]|nr:CAP domain-containing protein [Actinomycetota bacterium]